MLSERNFTTVHKKHFFSKILLPFFSKQIEVVSIFKFNKGNYIYCVYLKNNI